MNFSGIEGNNMRHFDVEFERTLGDYVRFTREAISNLSAHKKALAPGVFIVD